MLKAYPGAVCRFLWTDTYPGHDELSTQILNLSFHLAANVELMTVQGNSLQVGQQILFARRIRTLKDKGMEENSQNMPETAHNNTNNNKKKQTVQVQDTVRGKSGLRTPLTHDHSASSLGGWMTFYI